MLAKSKMPSGRTARPDARPEADDVGAVCARPGSCAIRGRTGELPGGRGQPGAGRGVWTGRPVGVVQLTAWPPAHRRPLTGRATSFTAGPASTKIGGVSLAQREAPSPRMEAASRSWLAMAAAGALLAGCAPQQAAGPSSARLYAVDQAGAAKSCERANSQPDGRAGNRRSGQGRQ